MRAIIHLKNIRKSFGNRRVLDRLTLSITEGEVYGLLGVNGSGKTTTINILCNMLQADNGGVEVSGKPVSVETKQILGVAPQENSIYQNLTVRENLDFFARIYGLSRQQRNQRIQELVNQFSFGEYADTVVAELSGGWQRRLNIAIAMVHSPKILILDEPTVGLDVESRYSLWELLRSLKSSGVTILLTTHYLDEAEHLCSRIGIMAEGRIIREGTLAELTALIPAAELAVVESQDEETVISRAGELGWQYRYYGGKLTLWLPEHYTLKEVVRFLDGLPVTAISLQPVRLEHVFGEVVKESNTNINIELDQENSLYKNLTA